MTASQVLFDVAAALDELGIPHMIAGSFASSLHGVPRTTHDIDFVIDPTPEQLERLIARFAPDS